MITENGIVTKTADGMAWVKTERSSACASCSSRHSCNPLGEGEDREVETRNRLEAIPGDAVVIQVDTAPMLKLVFLVYVFPIICMIVGAAAGQYAAPGLGADETITSVVGAVFVFSAAFLIIRGIGGKIAGNDAYRPKIVRIRKRISTDSSTDA